MLLVVGQLVVQQAHVVHGVGIGAEREELSVLHFRMERHSQIFQTVALLYVTPLYGHIVVGLGGVTYSQPLVVQAGFQFIGQAISQNISLHIVGRQIDGSLGMVEDVAHNSPLLLYLVLVSLPVPRLVEGNADVLKHSLHILGIHRGILVIENLVLMHAQHPLQDELADDVALVGTAIDSARLHAVH